MGAHCLGGYWPGGLLLVLTLRPGGMGLSTGGEQVGGSAWKVTDLPIYFPLVTFIVLDVLYFISIINVSTRKNYTIRYN